MTINEMEETSIKIDELETALYRSAEEFLDKANAYCDKLYGVAISADLTRFEFELNEAQKRIDLGCLYGGTLDNFHWLEVYMNLHPIE